MLSVDVMGAAAFAETAFTIEGPSGPVNATAVGTSSPWGAEGTVAGGAGPVNPETLAVGAAGRNLTVVFDATAADRIVPAGTSKTYGLRTGTITGFTAANSESYSIRLLGDATFATTTGSTAVDDSVSPGRVGVATAIAGTCRTLDGCGETADTASSSVRFVWSPNSTSSPTEAWATKLARPDWTNSYGIPGWPSLGSNMNVRVFSE